MHFPGFDPGSYKGMKSSVTSCLTCLYLKKLFGVFDFSNLEQKLSKNKKNLKVNFSQIVVNF